MKLLSTFMSDDLMRTAMVFRSEDTFIVDVLDNRFQKDKRYVFNDLQEAEDFAEDWVL